MTMQSTPQTGEVPPTDPVVPEVDFGMRLRRAREEQGISLREMARRLTRAHSNLWDYERGHRLATADIVVEYERELDLPEGELQVPLEAARRLVYGLDRDRRRPFRPPAAGAQTAPPDPAVPLAPAGSGQVRSGQDAPDEDSPRRPRSERRPSGPFVGRDHEVAAARAWLDEAKTGEPRIILLRGDAGIGKSTLLAHLLAEARGAGWLALSGSCRQGAPIAYLPVASALAPLRTGATASPSPLAALPELFLGEGAHPNGLDSDATADRLHLGLFVAVTRAVLEAADRQPLILAIDDLHWADDSTLGLLEHLASVVTQQAALTPLPLALIFTSRRPSEGEAAGRAIQRMKREVTYRELDLGGLDDLQINQVVTEVGRARPSPRLLRSVSGASQGNPLLLRSLLDRLLADGTIAVHDGQLTGEDLQLPAAALDLDAELGARLARVAGDCDELLTWAALLGDGQPLAALQAVAGYGDAEFDRLISAAVEDRVLHEDGDTYRFDHPELREVLCAKVPRRQRAGRHRAVAERLEAYVGAGGRYGAAALAHHLHLAGPDAPPGLLGRHALVAAEQSFALAAWSDAASFYDICIAAEAPDRVDHNLLWRAGVAHFRNHDHQAAQDRLTRAVDAARAAGDERAWGRAVLALTKSRVTGGSWLGADLDLDPVRDFLRHSHRDTADLRARAYSLLSDANFARFDFSAGFEQANEALKAAGGLMDDEVTAEVELTLGIQCLAGLQLDEAEAHLLSCERSTDRLGDPWAASWAASRLPLVHWCRGHLTEADAQAKTAAGLAAGHFDWAESSLAMACRTAVAVGQGRSSDAERLGLLAHQQYLRSDYLWTVLVLAPALLAGRAFRGDGARAQEALQLIASTGVDVRRFDLAARAVLGDGESVRVALADQPLEPLQGPSYSLFDLAFAALQIEMCDVTGDPELAQASLGPLELAEARGFEQVIGWVGSVPRLIGVAHRCLGRGDDAEKWLRRAIQKATTAPAPVETARARLNLAQVFMERGDDSAAAAEIEQCRRTFQEFGLTALVACSDRLRPGV